MTPNKKRHDSGEIKATIIRLNEVYGRMAKLASKRMKSYGPSILSEGNVTEEDIERRVKDFGESLTNFLKLRKRTNATLSTLENSLKSLKNAEDVDEISTLIGLTALSERREYNHNAATLRK